MKKIVWMFLVVFLVLFGFSFTAVAYDDHGYPYTMSAGCRQTCITDVFGFCQNNCTSYSAYMLNNYGVLFNNTYLQRSKPANISWESTEALDYK